ncbi:MAG: hypothetical protein ACRCU6_06030 [Fusobacteriaceae bacterium]
MQESLFYYVVGWVNPRLSPIDEGEHIITAEEKHKTRMLGRERGIEVDFVSAYTLQELNSFLHPAFWRFDVEHIAQEITYQINARNEKEIEKANLRFKNWFGLEDSEVEI